MFVSFPCAAAKPFSSKCLLVDNRYTAGIICFPPTFYPFNNYGSRGGHVGETNLSTIGTKVYFLFFAIITNGWWALVFSHFANWLTHGIYVVTQFTILIHISMLTLIIHIVRLSVSFLILCILKTFTIW